MENLFIGSSVRVPGLRRTGQVSGIVARSKVSTTGPVKSNGPGKALGLFDFKYFLLQVPSGRTFHGDHRRLTHRLQPMAPRISAEVLRGEPR